MQEFVEAPGPTDEAVRLLQETEDWSEQQGRDKKLGEFLQAAGRRFEDATLGSYRIEHPGQQQIINALRAFADTLPDHVRDGHGIVMAGPVGTGKDHCLVGVGRVAIVRHGFSVGWWRGVDLYSAFRDSIRRDEADSRLVDELTSPDILILSDPLPPTGAISEYQASRLMQVIDYRHSNCKPTWASMNVASSSEADERLSVPVRDRLVDGALVCRCDWPSYRGPLQVIDPNNQCKQRNENGNSD